MQEERKFCLYCKQALNLDGNDFHAECEKEIQEYQSTLLMKGIPFDLNDFTKFLVTRDTNQRPQVLMVTGVSGMGKSAVNFMLISNYLKEKGFTLNQIKEMYK